MPADDEQGRIVRVSIFDLDRTITRHGTWSPFLLFVARKGIPWRLAFLPGLLLAMGGYKLGLISRARLKMLMHSAMLGRRMRNARMSELASDFADTLVENGIYEEALAMIGTEKRAGRHVIIATAAHQFYAGQVAERCGVQSLVATQSHQVGDWLTNRIAGQNCYGAEKRAMIEDHFRKRGLSRENLHIRFYSDDLSDLPTFNWSDEPVAVNPSRKLLWYAMRNGWLIVDWRQKVLRRKNPSRASFRPESAPIRPASL